MRRFVGLAILIVLAGALALRLFVFEWLHTAGADMLPTMAVGDSFVVNRLARVPARGDLVVLEIPGSDASRVSVRRVIGVPGDRVELRTEGPIVGGQPAKHERAGQTQMESGPLARSLDVYVETLPGGRQFRIARDPQRHARDQPVVVVTAGNYYVLADNRDHGRDSREYGVVPASSLRGTITRKITSLVRYDPVQ
jgi:signal peptidase I